MKYRMKTDMRYSDDGVLLYGFSEADIRPGVTVLCGCNGSGKTTFMNRLCKYLKDEGVPTYQYYAGKKAKDRIEYGAAVRGSTEDLVQLLNSSYGSEGESLFDNMGYLAKELGSFVFSNEHDSDQRWIFIDSFDSGLSIDLMDEVGGFLDDMVGKLKPDGTDIYIIMAVNSYEFAQWPNWRAVSVQEWRDLQFDSYEDYRIFVSESRKLKDSRIEDSIEKEKEQWPLRTKRRR